jgi:putative lipoic acid-binding regulatory protein
MYFPTMITFKVICRNNPFLQGTIRSLICEYDIDPEISERASRRGKFISFTITALFPSEEILQNICSNIASIGGVLTIF